jgi:DNA repair exonuclease SbcCD ATPase subunit
MKKKIIYISIFIISILLAFLFGKLSSKKDTSQLQNDLKTATDKLTDIEKRNEELIQLTEKQESIINNLEVENQNSTKNIQSIKEINSSTAEKLNKFESSAESTINSLNKLKENNQILREYYNSITSVVEEES